MLEKIRKGFRKFRKAEEGLALLLVGVLVIVLLFIFGIFFIMNIVQIASAIAIIGFAVLAMGAGVILLKKGLEWMKKTK